MSTASYTIASRRSRPRLASCRTRIAYMRRWRRRRPRSAQTRGRAGARASIAPKGGVACPLSSWRPTGLPSRRQPCRSRLGRCRSRARRRCGYPPVRATPPNPRPKTAYRPRLHQPHPWPSSGATLPTDGGFAHSGGLEAALQLGLWVTPRALVAHDALRQFGVAAVSSTLQQQRLLRTLREAHPHPCPTLLSHFVPPLLPLACPRPASVPVHAAATLPHPHPHPGTTSRELPRRIDCVQALHLELCDGRI